MIALNPEADSTLPYLIRLPLEGHSVVLKARDVWPRTAKVYCHPATAWPEHPDIVERVPVRSCVRRGAAIDLVLDRSRENRSQIVFTRIRGGREAIFWQTARTAKQARPNVGLPRGKGAAAPFTILVDSHERYAWRFPQPHVEIARRSLPAGDYAVELDGAVLASVERKSLPDLAATLTGGRLRYLLAALAALPRAALVVEDRYSSVFGLRHVRPAVVADGLAEAQVRFPTVPIVFCETRQLAAEWTYRFLAAALQELAGDERAGLVVAGLGRDSAIDPAPAGPDPVAPEIRPVTADEVDEAGAVTLAAYQSLPGFPVDGRYAADLRDVGARSRGATVLVAVEKGRVLGTVTLVDDPSSPWSESLQAEEVGIRMLGVDPASHGRGIGTALLESCLDRARAAGAVRAVLHSTSSMTVAHRIYRRAGFQRTPERDVMLADFHLMAFTLDLR